MKNDTLTAGVHHYLPEFRDYTPPPAHHRHTARVTERRVGWTPGQPTTPQLSEREALKRAAHARMGTHQRPKRHRGGDTRDLIGRALKEIGE